jgi:MFS family permease
MNVFGKFIAGPVSDRIGIPRTLSACGILLGLPLLAMAVARTPLAVYAAVFVFGLGYGGAIALLSPTVAELFGTDDINALFGLTSLSFAVTGSLAPFLAGLGYDVFGSYTLPLVVTGVVGLLSVPALEVARRRQG